MSIKLTSRKGLTKGEVAAMMPLVEQQLHEKVLIADKPQGHLANTYTSKAYSVWLFIYTCYDGNMQWLQHWLVCRVCRKIRYVVTGGSGTGKLLDHHCYKQFQSQIGVNEVAVQGNKFIEFNLYEPELKERIL